MRRSGSPPNAASPRISSNSRCFMGFAPTCNAASCAKVTACAFTFRSERTGSRTSCGGSPSAPPTCSSLPKICCAGRQANRKCKVSRTRHAFPILLSSGRGRFGFPNGLTRLERMNFDAGDVLCKVAKLLGRPCQHWERSVVNGEDVMDAKQADRVGGFARSHREMAADRQADQIGFVEFADDFHVAKNCCVAGMVQREAAGQPHDQACGFTHI